MCFEKQSNQIANITLHNAAVSIFSALLQAMVLDTGGIDIPAKMARLYA